ncbi:PF06252 domain protein [Peptostreptococcaceae bacterium AS15]|nr:PF06252 domain protein [Peptostreptococcaceae bacterium AS15]
MFKVDRIEWLSEDDCSKLIEILKKMIIRQGKEKELED